jgi:hypothetical protein
MTLKPNYLQGFLKTIGWFFGLIVLMSGVIPYFRGQPVDWAGILSMALIGSIFFGVFVCVMFTPREISWDDKKISLHVNFPKSGEYTWEQLEAYSMWGGRFGTFLLKFEGIQAYQIVPVCFRAEEWKAFQSFLRTRFPEMKTWVWFGPVPIRFGKK